MMTSPVVVAIDGPAASGKTTLARRLAEHLNLPFLDTGLLYRAVAHVMLKQHLAWSDVQGAVRAAEGLIIEHIEAAHLRDESIALGASKVAAVPTVRAALLALQRNFMAKGCGAILAGRDIGTVVCPDASYKIFVTASVEERARRRWREMHRDGEARSYDKLVQELRERDRRDVERVVAPMLIASDAWVLDTTHLNESGAFTEVCQYISNARPQGVNSNKGTKRDTGGQRSSSFRPGSLSEPAACR